MYDNLTKSDMCSLRQKTLWWWKHNTGAEKRSVEVGDQAVALGSYLIMSQPCVCESEAHCSTNLLQLCVALDERLQRNGRKTEIRAPQTKRDLFSSVRH